MAAQEEIARKDAVRCVLIGALLGALLLIGLGFVVMMVGFVGAAATHEHHGDMDGLGLYALFALSVIFSPIAAAVGAVAGLIFSFIRVRKHATAGADQPNIRAEMYRVDTGAKDDVWPPTPTQQKPEINPEPVQANGNGVLGYIALACSIAGVLFMAIAFLNVDLLRDLSLLLVSIGFVLGLMSRSSFTGRVALWGGQQHSCCLSTVSWFCTYPSCSKAGTLAVC